MEEDEGPKEMMLNMDSDSSSSSSDSSSSSSSNEEESDDESESSSAESEAKPKETKKRKHADVANPESIIFYFIFFLENLICFFHKSQNDSKPSFLRPLHGLDRFRSDGSIFRFATVEP